MSFTTGLNWTHGEMLLWFQISGVLIVSGVLSSDFFYFFRLSWDKACIESKNQAQWSGVCNVW